MTAQFLIAHPLSDKFGDALTSTGSAVVVAAVTCFVIGVWCVVHLLRSEG